MPGPADALWSIPAASDSSFERKPRGYNRCLVRPLRQAIYNPIYMCSIVCRVPLRRVNMSVEDGTRFSLIDGTSNPYIRSCLRGTRCFQTAPFCGGTIDKKVRAERCVASKAACAAFTSMHGVRGDDTCIGAFFFSLLFQALFLEQRVSHPPGSHVRHAGLGDVHRRHEEPVQALRQDGERFERPP